MSRNNASLWTTFLVLLLTIGGPLSAADDAAVERAWQDLPKYEHGQDVAGLLTIDRAVIDAMASAASRAACAARLAALLEAADTTLAARQYICFQLRQVGTPAQVPLLAKLLDKPETADAARGALEAIPGDASLVALRAALGTSQGSQLVGVINSLAARRDSGVAAQLQDLAGSEDRQIAAAALWALGNIADGPSAAFLARRAEQAGLPTPPELAVPLLRCAAGAGDRADAIAIYTSLIQPGQAPGVRRAAFEGLLRLQGDQAAATVMAWFRSDDADQRRVAAGHLAMLTDQQLDELLVQLASLPESAQFVLLEILAPRKGDKVLPLVMSAARSDKPELQLAGVRCLGLLGDATAVPFLVDTLAVGGPLTTAAQESLGRLPRKEVGDALVTTLTERPELRGAAIEVLKKLKYYEAIDPLIAIAASDDPQVHGPALDGLQGIADPDEHDIPRLVGLLLRTPAGQRRDEVERTIVVVCDKLPPGADRSPLVLAALAKADPAGAQAAKYLPLLGRLGGPRVLEQVEAALRSDRPEVKQAAVRALCNWPNAEVADRLWAIVERAEPKAAGSAALRAYVRVVTLPGDRPEAQTLAMLQKAMPRAESAEDRQWVLNRASTVRTIESVDWIAGYLDDPAVAQAACLAVVELAHHRFLRQPNMDRFGPLLDRISTLSKDPDVAARAKKYRLGL